MLIPGFCFITLVSEIAVGGAVAGTSSFCGLMLRFRTRYYALRVVAHRDAAHALDYATLKVAEILNTP